MLQKLLARFGYVKPPQKRSAGFSAADYSRVTASMNSESEHIMRILRYQGKALRARARQISSNTSYGAKFESMCVSNICGPNPFRLQAKIKYASGKFDTGANGRIESEWKSWGKPGKCDFEGRLSWSDLLRLSVRILARDGECLIRLHEGTNAGPWGLQLQVIDVDRLDEDLNKELPNGNVIVTGVELDENGRTVAYHLLKRKPRDWHVGVAREYVRVPAEQMIHIFVPLFAEQVRGVPWMYAAILKLHQIGAFEEAAIIAARVGASKMGFYQQKADAAGDLVGGATANSNGDFIQSAEPGEFGQLPAGWEFKEWNPNYPDAQVGPFLKACLRGVASGCNVTYHSLANDLEGVNLSSARAGLLEERDNWMMMQTFLSERLPEPIYERWLLNSLLMRKMPFPLERSDKYMDIYFQPKRWPWIDPLKDVQAKVMGIQWRLGSRTAAIGEAGEDIEDVFDAIKKEEDLAAEKGITIAPAGEQPQGESDEEDPDKDGE